MKKVLSLVLVMAMVLSSMSFAFSAESKFSDMEGNDYAKAVNTLNALGVVDGYEDGTYQPTKTVKRAEMAKLMVELLGYGDLVTTGTKSNFVDTQGHWAEPYIALANGRGIVVGTGDGRFNPEGIVTYDQVFTMLVRGLGYTDHCNELKGMTWPTNFKVKASELGIITDVKMSTAEADRGGVAQAMYNALECALVSVDTDGNVTTIKDPVLKDSNKLLLSRVADFEPNFVVDSEKLDPDNKHYAGDKVDLKPYMFQNLQAYTNKNDKDEVVYIKKSNSIVLEGSVDDTKSATTTSGVSVLSVEGKNSKVTDIELNNLRIDGEKAMMPKAYVFQNGEMRESDIALGDLEDSESIVVVGNENDSTKYSGKISQEKIWNAGGLVIELQTRVARVSNQYVADKTKLDVFDLPVSNKKVDLDKVEVTGAASSLEDIKEDDVVVEYKAVDKEGDVIRTKLVVSRDTVEGKVTRINGDDIYVDGTAYTLSGTYGCVSNLSLGDEGIFYLDHNGDLVDVDTEASGPSNYAVIVDYNNGEIKTSDATKKDTIKTYPTIKLATQNNETVTYDIYTKINDKGEVTGGPKVNGKYIVTDKDLKVNIGVYTLVKYTVNKDGKISKLTIEATGLDEAKNYDKQSYDFEKSGNKLSSNVIVFDATGNEFDVVGVADVPSDVRAEEAVVIRDNNGNIKVVVIADGIISNQQVFTYVYINKLNPATDKNTGDNTKLAILYTDGKKQEILLDSEDTITDTVKNDVFGVKYKDGVIEKISTGYNVKNDPGVTTDGKALSASVRKSTVTTATGINARDGSIQLTGGTKWYSLSEHATVLGIDTTDSNKVRDIRSLYDIEKEKTKFEIYINADGEVDLILIHEK